MSIIIKYMLTLGLASVNASAIRPDVVLEPKTRKGIVAPGKIASFDDLFGSMLKGIHAHETQQEKNPARAWDEFEYEREGDVDAEATDENDAADEAELAAAASSDSADDHIDAMGGQSDADGFDVGLDSEIERLANTVEREEKAGGHKHGEVVHHKTRKHPPPPQKHLVLAAHAHAHKRSHHHLKHKIAKRTSASKLHHMLAHRRRTAHHKKHDHKNLALLHLQKKHKEFLALGKNEVTHKNGKKNIIYPEDRMSREAALQTVPNQIRNLFQQAASSKDTGKGKKVLEELAKVYARAQTDLDLLTISCTDKKDEVAEQLRFAQSTLNTWESSYNRVVGDMN